MPIAAERPIPSDPPGNSTPGTLWSGWPCRRLFIFRRVLSSLVGRYPASARVENRTGAACPLDRTNRSRSGQSGRLGSCRILWKNNETRISTAERLPPGCPDFASATISRIWARILAAFCRSIPMGIDCSSIISGPEPELSALQAQVLSWLEIEDRSGLQQQCQDCPHAVTQQVPRARQPLLLVPHQQWTWLELLSCSPLLRRR